MVRVQCPECQRRYRTRIEAFGRTAVCSRCNRTFKIGESRPPFAWKSNDLAEDSWIGVEAPAEKVERKHCIICDAPLRAGEIRCPECGANQVTGLVQRRAPKGETREWSVGNYIPIRSLVILSVVAGIACVCYLAIGIIAKSATKTAEQLADESVIRDAAKYLREGGDEFTFGERFSGRVNDANLPRFVKRLSAGDIAIRHAAALLIGSGQISSVAPVTEWARQATEPPFVVEVLGRVGARRLVEQSCAGDEKIRRAAAEAMLLLCGMPADEAKITTLAAQTAVAEKVARYNEMCRPWPEATGRFQLFAGDKLAPLEASVEQIGKMFYLRLGGREFASDPKATRQFAIPIEQYCAATGTAVSAASVRDLMRGEVRLSSPLGAGWEGMLTASMRRQLDGPLPGFLPVEKPATDGAISVPVRLERSR